MLAITIKRYFSLSRPRPARLGQALFMGGRAGRIWGGRSRAFSSIVRPHAAFILTLIAPAISRMSTQVLRHLSLWGEICGSDAIPAAGEAADQLSHVLLNRWPAEWLKRYSSRGACSAIRLLPELNRTQRHF
jgi:hypothetical protein